MHDHSVFRDHLIELENGLTRLTARLYSDEAAGTTGSEGAATQAQSALDLCTHLVGASAIAGNADCVPEAEFLLTRIGGVARVCAPPSAAELAENMPWLLRATLDTLLESQAVSGNPIGPEAIAARLLAAMVEALGEPPNVQTRAA